MTTTPPTPILGKYAWSVRHFPRFDETETVTLHVGPDEIAYTAHRNYLTWSSDFFQKALNDEENKGQPRIVKLPEESPPVVNAYLRFIYGGGLETANVTYCPHRDSCFGRSSSATRLMYITKTLPACTHSASAFKTDLSAPPLSKRSCASSA